MWKNVITKNMNGNWKWRVFFAVITLKDIWEMERKWGTNIPLYIRLSYKWTWTWNVCSKVMMILFLIMEAVGSGWNLENIRDRSKYSNDIVCRDGCGMFMVTVKNLRNENFFKEKFFEEWFVWKLGEF